MCAGHGGDNIFSGHEATSPDQPRSWTGLIRYSGGRSMVIAGLHERVGGPILRSVTAFLPDFSARGGVLHSLSQALTWGTPERVSSSGHVADLQTDITDGK